MLIGHDRVFFSRGEERAANMRDKRQVAEYTTTYWQGPRDDRRRITVKAPEAAMIGDGSAKILETLRGANRITVHLEASSEARVVIPQIYFPSWAAEADGVELEVAPFGDGLASAVVPAGTRTVEFRQIVPPAERVGMFVSLAALAAMAGLSAVAAASRRAQRRTATVAGTSD
jgi:hypothetical protein